MHSVLETVEYRTGKTDQKTGKRTKIAVLTIWTPYKR